MIVNTILTYWLEDVGPNGWYAATPQLDADIRTRFAPLWAQEQMGEAGLNDWPETPDGALARILLLDQFSRNMFRGSARAYASDAAALAAAKAALVAGYDLEIAVPARQFFYLPFMHAEDLAAQDRGVDLFDSRMPGDNSRHARAHRAVIARFGRFPWRNPELGRVTTPEEAAFLEAGGYAFALQEIPAIEPSSKIV
ncbi:DUF924 family protein [Phaeovulum sp. W22_SRMD_FR3]|uniref:DUF924 family protein n=1 Tax=Phaeovulum sp. W22_SRMD_FR3 TaxID=3240274 RepID=UPI003F959F46